ncbi:MAG TPA: MFS transporter [Caulobacteraceae bacterium]|jgi:AAHS family 4-hydroxybenzoate transporter-like MFS transporter
MTDGAERRFDVDGFLNACRVRGVHIRILIILGLVMLVDGYDLFVAGAVLPVIATAWHVKPSALTGVIVSQQFGLLTGVLLTGPLSDRFGRKRMLIGCLIGFGLASFAVTLARSPAELMALRFTSAIFFSGALPNCVSFVSEIAPKRMQAGLISLVFCGYTAGQLVCASVLAFVIEPFGWQGGFYMAGLLPLLLCPLVVFFLPESIRFRVTRDPQDPRIGPMLRQFDPNLALTGHERFELQGAERGRRRSVPIGKLFVGPLMPMTVLLWLAYLLAFTANQLVQNWDTTIFHHLAAIPYKRVATMLACRTVLGIFGMATAGFVMDRFGSARALAVFFALCGVVYAALAFSNLASSTGFVVYALSGYAINSALSALNCQAAIVYPPSVRVTGVAWASGFGRLGGMLGPVIGGVMLAGHPSTTSIYLTTAAPEFLGALIAAGMLWAGRNSRRKPEPEPAVVSA